MQMLVMTNNSLTGLKLLSVEGNLVWYWEYPDYPGVVTSWILEKIL